MLLYCIYIVRSALGLSVQRLVLRSVNCLSPCCWHFVSTSLWALPESQLGGWTASRRGEITWVTWLPSVSSLLSFDLEAGFTSDAWFSFVSSSFSLLKLLNMITILFLFFTGLSAQYSCLQSELHSNVFSTSVTQLPCLLYWQFHRVSKITLIHNF